MAQNNNLMIFIVRNISIYFTSNELSMSLGLKVLLTLSACVLLTYNQCAKNLNV